MIKYFAALFSAVTLLSCKTDQLYLTVTEPAPVTIPAYIKSVGVIDRSMPTDETKVVDNIDKALSLEGANLDKDGAVGSVKGLSDELSSNNRFAEIKTLSDIDFRTSSLELFPVPLSWEIVSQICSESGTDALFSLEKFDTDTRVSYSAGKTELKTPFGSIPGIEHQADMQTIVKTGWRIYDPESRSILDEYIYQESISKSGRGINPLAALQAFTGRKEAVLEVGNMAGHGYAMRILPFRLRVMRDYFVKGSDNFKIAKRKAQVGQWDEAGKLWKKETDNPKMKVAGRAVYNMAIISEINGDVDGALQWAQKAWGDYNIREALEYVRILENRKYKNDVLKEQGEVGNQ